MNKPAVRVWKWLVENKSTILKSRFENTKWMSIIKPTQKIDLVNNLFIIAQNREVSFEIGKRFSGSFQWLLISFYNVYAEFEFH